MALCHRLSAGVGRADSLFILKGGGNMREYVCYDGPAEGAWYRCVSQPILIAIGFSPDEPDTEIYRSHLLQSDAEILLHIREVVDGTEICCFSRTPQIKAIEFMDFLFGSYGVMKGDREMAVGKMPAVLLQVQLEEFEDDSPASYFMRRAIAYYTETEIVESVSYVAANESYVATIPKYYKKAVKWAFVRTTDISAPGTGLCIKSLESEDGVCFVADENLYIMIGCLGEVYEIAGTKFHASYEESDEKLDIFSTFFDFLPAVELTESGEYCPIDELANICYPKPGNGILARALERRTKILRKDSLDYFIGNPGDYMAIRCDDMTDLYIIQKEVFLRTYEETGQVENADKKN